VPFRHTRISCMLYVCALLVLLRGLEPPRDLSPTRPSTERVCRFRHNREKKNVEGKLYLSFFSDIYYCSTFDSRCQQRIFLFHFRLVALSSNSLDIKL